MKYFKLLLIAVLLVGLLSSCYDDKGNYSYNRLDEVYIENINKKTIISGDTLIINPVLGYRKLNDLGNEVIETGTITDISNFEFTWHAIPPGNVATIRTLVSQKANFGEPVNLPVITSGNYRIEIRAKNKSTGITAFTTFELNIVGRYLDAFLLLTQDGNNVDLDLYATTPDSVKILEKNFLQSINYPYRTGTANFIMYQKYRSANRIWVGTDEGVSWISPIDWSWDEGNVLSSVMPAGPPKTFSSCIRTGTHGNVNAFYNFFYEGALYRLDNGMSRNVGVIDNGINGLEELNIAPNMIGGDLYTSLLFDNKYKQFVTYSTFNLGATSPQTSVIPLKVGDGDGTGLDCKHIQPVALVDNVSSVAIVKHPNGKYIKHHFNRKATFPYVSVLLLDSDKELVGTDALGTVDHWAIGLDRGQAYAVANNTLYCFRESESESGDAWKPVVYKDATGAALTINFDNISFLHVEDFKIDHYSKSIYVVTYSATNGGQIYVLEPNFIEPTELVLNEIIKGIDGKKIGDIKGFSYFGY